MCLVTGGAFAAGDPADNYARFIAQRLQDELKQSFIIDNKPFVLIKDFMPIAPVNSCGLLLVAHPSVQVKTVAELIQYAKAHPGKLNYAS